MLLTTDTGTTFVSGQINYRILQAAMLCLLMLSQLILSILIAVFLKDQLCTFYPATVIIIVVWTIWQLWRVQNRLVQSVYDALSH